MARSPLVSLGIFAKPPYPGMVKTRLIPELGADKATRVYRYCLEHTLKVARCSQLEYKLYLSAACDDALLQGEHFALQHGHDLGARMLSAFKQMLAGDSDGALIIGSDCLDLNADHLLQAAQALSEHELVLLPAVDGGYALIGCRIIEPNLFRQVRWSSEQVLAQTVTNAKSLNYRVSLLETVRDIDTLQDLEHYPELLGLIAG